MTQQMEDNKFIPFLYPPIIFHHIMNRKSTFHALQLNEIKEDENTILFVKLSTLNYLTI